MDKKQRDLIAAIALVSVFFLIVARGAFIKKGSQPEAMVAPIGAGAADLSFLQAVRKNDELRSAQAAVWQKDWNRDPFLTETRDAALGNLKLIGVVWDEKEPYAMVNGKVVKIGDAVEGYRVLEIKQDSVMLWSEAGKFHELKLFEEKSSS